MIHARLCQPIVIRARAHTTRPVAPRNRAAPSTVIARAPATARTQDRHCTLAGLRPATSCPGVQSRPARQPSGLGAIGTGGDCPVKPGNDACWMAGGISCRDAPSSLSSPPHTRHRTGPTRDCTRPQPSLHAPPNRHCTLYACNPAQRDSPAIWGTTQPCYLCRRTPGVSPLVTSMPRVIARTPATARAPTRHCTLAGLRPATSCLCVQSRPARQPRSRRERRTTPTCAAERPACRRW